MYTCTERPILCELANVLRIQEFGTSNMERTQMTTCEWRSATSSVRALITDGNASQQQFCSLVQELDYFTYPVDGLTASVSAC